jgi:hypothetical protein
MRHLCLSIVLTLLALLPTQAAVVDHLDRLKDPCLQTPLVSAGKPQAMIVPGEDPRLQELAKTLQAEIARLTGVQLPLVSASSLTEETLRQQHCLALGDCSSNALIGKLYARRLCFVDGIYPGKGLANPGFDRDSNSDGTPDLWAYSTPTGATHALALDSTQFRSAPNSVRIDGKRSEPEGRACVMRNLDVKPGRSYRMTVAYRATLGPKARGLFHVDFYDNGTPSRPLGGSDVTLQTADQWTTVTNAFKVPEGTAFGRILLYLHGEGSIWYDDVALYEEGSTTNLLALGNPGVAVQTVHDPWGAGRNVVVVAASEPAGFELALQRLLETIRRSATGTDLILPDLMDLQPGDTALADGIVPATGPSDTAIATQAAAARSALDTNAFVPVRDTMQGTKTMARNWYLTGDERWARLYAAIWRQILDTPASNARGPMEWTFNTLEGWDLIDECPALPDSLKLEILNRLLLIGVRNEQAYGRSVQSVNRPIVDGHQLDQGLCLYMHGAYFDRYYGINGHWKTMTEPLITLGEQTPRVHDSYAYGPIAGNDFLSEYALKSGDMDYFTNGNCLLQARWQMLCTDNINGGGTFGDDGAWRGSLPTGLLQKANWFYSDDTLKWFLQGLRPPLGAFANDRPAKLPTDLLGVAYIPLKGRLYDVAASTRKDPEAAKWPVESVPPGKAFDKLSLRTGFTPEDQYLLLDGISVLSHGHEDGASILRFTDNGRLFLAEGHYVEISARRHNTMLVSHDGVSYAPPPLVSLESKASLGSAGLVEVLSSAYNGVDWRRSLLWLPEEAIVIVDRLTAREPGEYSFEALWRSLGDARLSDNGAFTVDQQGESMTISRADDSLCRAREMLDYHGINYYGSYPYCSDGLVKELRQTQQHRLQPGESSSFLNVIQTHKTGQAPAPVRRLPGDALLVGSSNRFVAGAGQPTFKGAPDTDARLWIVRESGAIAVAEATRFRWGALTVTTSAPASYSLTFAPARLTADCSAPTTYHLELQGKSLDGSMERGSADLTGLAAPSQPVFAEQFRALESLATTPPVAMPAPSTAQPTAKPLWQAELPPMPRLVTSEAGTQVTCTPSPLPVSTWDAAYRIDPQRLTSDWDSIVLWPEDQAAEITVSLPQMRDISRVAVRTMCTNNSARGISYRLASLTLSAAENLNGPWTELKRFEDATDHEVPSYPDYAVDTPGLHARYLKVSATPRKGCALFLKGLRAWGLPETPQTATPRIEPNETGSASALCKASLTPGADSVICGLRDGTVLAYTAGKAAWSADAGARVNCLAAANLDGKPGDEILVGTNGQRLLCLDPTGKVLWTREFPFFWGRQGNVMWIGLGDVNGDGQTEVVVSCENWHFYCLDAKGTDLWAFEVEHAGQEGALGDLKGDGKLETLCGQEYYGWDVLDSAGKRLYVVSGPGPISTAALCADLNGDGKDEAVFGAQTCGIYVRDGAGNRVFDANVGGFVTDLTTLRDPQGTLLVASAESHDFSLAAFRSDGSAAWRRQLSGVPLMLAACGDSVAVGCDDGLLQLVDAGGQVTPLLRLSGPVRNAATADVDGDGQAEILATGDRELVAVKLPPKG